MLIENLSMGYALGCLAQGVMTYQQIGNEINQELLPDGERECLLNVISSYEQQYSDRNEQKALAKAAMLVMMVMVMMVMLISTFLRTLSATTFVMMI